MILTWNNTDSYQRHIEEMNSFRRAHARLAPCRQQRGIRAFTTVSNKILPSPAGPDNPFTDADGKIIVVPIWTISSPKGAQN